MSEEIKIEDFMKIDLRVAKIKEAIEVPEADKLIKLILDVGELGEKTVFAGIKSAYSLEELQDKFVVVVSNLKPRQMKFGLSEGMILAAGPGGSEVFMVSADDGVQPGMRVK
jgi:methionyl-tRNA synthetase